MANINLFDRTSGSVIFSNETIISVEITNGGSLPNAVLLSENQTTQPLSTNPDFVFTLPGTYTFDTIVNELKTVYMWTMDSSFNVSAIITSDSISLDTVPPTDPSISLKDRTNGNINFTNERVVCVVFNYIPSEDIACWLLSESQTSIPIESDPNWLTYVPTTFSLSDQVEPGKELKTVYAWIKDTAGNINTGAIFDVIWLDVINPAEPNLVVYDRTTGSTLYTNEATVSVLIFNDPEAEYWLLEEGDVKPPIPSEFDSRWQMPRPDSFVLSQTATFIDELRKIWVWLKDQAGNISPILFNFANHVIRFDTILPPDPNFLVFDRTTGSPLYTAERIVSVDISNDAEAKYWLLSESQSTLPDEFDTAWSPYEIKPELFTLDDWDGLHTVYVWTKDIAGNINNDAKAPVSDTIYSDTTIPNEPIVEISDRTSASQLYTNNIVISIDISNDPDVNGWVVSESQTTPPLLGQFGTEPVTFLLTSSEGTKKLYVWVKDLVGNINTGVTSVEIILDLTSPEAEFELIDTDAGKLFWDLYGPISNSQIVSTNVLTSSIDVGAWLFSESQTVAPEEFDSNFVYSLTPPETYKFETGVEEVKTVFLWVKDFAGNINNVTTFDITYQAFIPPLIKSFYSQTDIDNNTLNINSTSYRLFDTDIDLYWTIPAAVINEKDYREATIYVQSNLVSIAIPPTGDTNDIASLPTTVIVTGLTNIINPIITQDGQTIYENQTILDSVLNTFDYNNASGTLTLELDNISYLEVLSTPGDFVLQDRTNGSFIYTDERIVSVGLTSLYGPAERWLLTETPGFPTSLIDFATDKPITFELSAGNGPKLVYAWFVDDMPNIIDNPATFLINLNIDEPILAGTTLDLIDRTSGNQEYTNEEIISIEISGDDNAAYWMLSETQITPPGDVDTRWVDSKPLTFDLSSGDGLKTVYAWFMTLFGNVSDFAVFNTITLDTVLPTSGNLQLSDRVTGSETIAQNQIISIDISGETGDPVAWLVSETQLVQPEEWDPDFLSYKPTTFELALPDGLKTVYVWSKDIAGNISLVPLSDSIVLDTTAPIVGDLILRDRTSGSSTHTNMQTVSVFILNDEPNIECWLLSENSSPPSIGDPRFVTTMPTTFVLSAGNGLKTVYLWEKDTAGNISAPLSPAVATIILDTSSPTLLKATYDPATRRLTLVWNEVVTNVDKSKIKIIKG